MRLWVAGGGGVHGVETCWEKGGVGKTRRREER